MRLTEEQARAETFTAKQARHVIEVQHSGEPFSLFVAEVGDKPLYSGKEILDWLGY